MCYNPCGAKTCDNLDPPPGRICTALCETNKCDCKDGYRRLNGTCIPETQCPQYCPGQNEVKVSCYNECLNTRACPGVVGPDQTCTNQTCTVGCDCRSGYNRNECGICVPEAECSTGCSCPSNESVQCVNSCSKNTCEIVVSGVLRKCAGYCSKTCECDEGFARLNGNFGECVPEKECCVYYT